jgi:hypothetical protein
MTGVGALLVETGMSATVDSAALREVVRKKYRDVAIRPDDKYHFHTGRPLAARLDYDSDAVNAMRTRPSSPLPA